MSKTIITGGPGSGKTTLLNLIAQQGYSVTPEAAREVIREVGVQVPDLQERIIAKQKDFESEYNGQFQDRSLVDNIAYINLRGDKIPSNLRTDIIHSDYGRVFILEPLPKEFYVQDDERKESYEEAVQIYHALTDAYKECGFEVITLAATTPEDKLAKVLAEHNKEIEIKLRGHVRPFVQSVYLGKTFEKNYVTQTSDGIERIREETHQEQTRYAHTIKRGQGVNREEYEKQISFKEAQNMLNSWSQLSARYDKVREEYISPDAPQTRIYLDTIAGEQFTEIESVSEEQLYQTLDDLCGVRIEHKSYTQLFHTTL